jgi:endo-1,4-beta-xylanase
MRRRELLTAALAVTATAICPPTIASGGVPSLRTIASARGLETGSCFANRGPRRYLDLLATHCDILTPEWQLKPGYLRPEETSSYNFEASDEIAAFCERNGQSLHGHTLFWHQDPIRWAESSDFEEVKRRYGGFIRDVMARYPQAVSWDVLNEIASEGTLFRDEVLIRRFGYDFIEFCFRVAHETAPAARLVLNDYGLECAADWCGNRRRHMLEIVRELKRRDVPIHVVGIQGHLSHTWMPSSGETARFIAQVADLGVDVYLSELDVNDAGLPDDVEVRDRMVADTYEEFLTTVLRDRAVKRVMFWGISDSDNWIVHGYAPEQRENGKPRTALFDENDEPKLAYHAVARAIAGAPAR